MRRKNYLWGAGGVVNLALSALLIFPLVAGAAPQERITICHATASQSNPYVVITVNQNSILNDSGHGNSGINEGDIIPPFDYMDGNSTAHYAGHNWTGDNQAFFNNNCSAPAVTPTTGTLVVQKVISGGTAVSGDFSLHVMSSGEDVTGSPQAGTSTGTSYTLGAGTYAISETGGPSNYTASFSSGCTGGNATIVLGQTITCTVTNTFNAPVNNNIDLAVTKTVSNSTPFAGNSVNYTVTVTNNGPATATNVTLNDALPSGLTFGSAITGNGSYSSGTGVWTIGSLASGASASLTLMATVNAGTGGNTITNTATASATQTDTNTANNSASASLVVQTATPPATSIDLAVSKSVNNSNPSVGTNVTYTVTATNNGPANATNVVITDALPTGLTYGSSVAGQGSYTSGTGAWAVGPLNSGASATLTIVANVNSGTAGSTITNTATAVASETDNNPSNNSASSSVIVANPGGAVAADISVTKTVNNTSPATSSNVTYTITVTNNGPNAATGVVLNDVLPAGVSFGSSVISGGSFNTGTGAWTIGNLTNGASATLSLVAGVTASASTTVTNTATVTAAETDNTPGNNTASASFTVPPTVSNTTGGGGGGGGPAPTGIPVIGGTTTTPGLPFPQGQVLGETTDVPNVAANDDQQVLGETADLPRTGLPNAVTWLQILAFAALLVMIPKPKSTESK